MNITPQRLWNKYGLILLIIVALRTTLDCLINAANLLLKGNRAFYAYKIAELQLFRVINISEADNYLDRIQAIVSQTKGFFTLYISLSMLIFAYWALTLCRLYLRRRRGMVDNLSLPWRPKFAFSLLIPLAAPIKAYTDWKIVALSGDDPIILDFFSKISAVRPVQSVDFNNLKGSLLTAFSFGILWLLYFGLMKLLGMAATRLGFK